MNKWNEVAEVVGVPFNKPFKTNESEECYIITEKGFAYYNENLSPDYDRVLISHFLEGILTPKIIKPKRGEKYWSLDAIEKECVFESNWTDYDHEYLLLERGLIFTTKEQAQEKAKEYGWM